MFKIFNNKKILITGNTGFKGSWLSLWLKELGAERSQKSPSLWVLFNVHWTAEIEMGRDELKVTWREKEKISQCSFPYGLSRNDVQNAMNEGP